MKTLGKVLIAIASIILAAQLVSAQSKCLSPDDVKRMLAQINSTQPGPFNKKLRSDLLRMQEKSEDLIGRAAEKATEKKRNADKLKMEFDKRTETNGARFCQILKESGWPTKDAVGPDGAGAAFYLLENSASLELQNELFPVIVAAVKRNVIPKHELARLVDRMRVDAGMKQLFGTQASIINGFLVLPPIEAEAQVDSRRRQFGLVPLAQYLRGLERVYRMPLVRSPVAPVKPSAAQGTKNAATDLLNGEAADADEVIRVDTNLVSMNVSVFNEKLRTYIGSLDKTDFKVSEDGHEEELTYFAATDLPFDLVLLIDLSGSTSEKRKLISQTTQRFIEVARPADRLAIVTFSDTVNAVCEMTSDRAKLNEAANQIDGSGGTKFWDALKFTLDQVVGPKSLERRRAIVVMSDGVDNALGFFGAGSQISFSELLEAVRQSDTLIIPIYLDTEFDSGFSGGSKMYENARKTMALLAQESGGLYYKARKIEDLKGVYEQVLNDLGKVYSLGYKPSNEKRDGSWRKVKIEIPNHPELKTRSKPGYYAN
jgi:VWFA-related protein